MEGLKGGHEYFFIWKIKCIFVKNIGFALYVIYEKEREYFDNVNTININKCYGISFKFI